MGLPGPFSTPSAPGRYPSPPADQAVSRRQVRHQRGRKNLTPRAQKSPPGSLTETPR
jgi:hypothetical protein